MALEYVNAIAEIDSPLDSTAIKANQFLFAFRELFGHHLEQEKWYREFVAGKDIGIEQCVDIAALRDVPFVVIDAFREFELSRSFSKESAFKFSSQYRKNTVKQCYDSPSKLRIDKALSFLSNQFPLFEGRIANFVTVSKSKSESELLFGLYYFHQLLRSGVEADINSFAFEEDAKEILTVLGNLAKEPIPLVLICGGNVITQLCDELRSKQIELSPASGSVLVTVNHSLHVEKRFSFSNFAQQVSNSLGLEGESICDLYLQPEFSIPFISCSERVYHVPVYSHIIVRDVLTLEPLPPGKKGLLQVFNVLDSTTPVHSLLTKQIAMTSANPCRCGLQSQAFSIVSPADLDCDAGGILGN